MSNGGEDISCPQCRRPSNIEDFVYVGFTATQQWDQLLEIAGQFAAIEGLLGPDTSEEEEEEKLWENFIDDGDSEARFVAVAVDRYIRCAYCGNTFVAPILRSTIQHLMEWGKTNRTWTLKGNTLHIRGLV
jgi:hypothetical protein